MQKGGIIVMKISKFIMDHDKDSFISNIKKEPLCKS